MLTEEETGALLREADLRYQGAKQNSSNLPALSSFFNIPIQHVASNMNGLACRSGCAHCCYLRVVAYPFEVVSIYFYLVSKLDRKSLATFNSLLAEKAQIISRMSVDEHFTTNIQCPMLIDNKCSVYSVRPMACAGYHSLSEEACRDSYERPEVLGVEEGGIPMIYEMQASLSLQNEIAEEIFSANRDDSGKYELIFALQQIFQKPALLQRWRDGRKMFSHEPG